MAQAPQRQTKLTFHLGSDPGEQIKLVSLQAREALSQPFLISIEGLALSEIKLLPNLGQAATVHCNLEDKLVRYFNGVLIDARFVSEVKGAGFLYLLTLAPKSHFHQHGRNFRIFQNRSPIEIVKDVLNRCGIDYDVKATGGTRKLAYCVQYGESDFDFVNRLLEQEGIYYYYLHTSDAHVMTMCDKPSQHENLDPDTLTYNPSSEPLVTPDSRVRSSPDLTLVQTWHEHASSGGEAKFTHQDYDFKKSTTSIETSHSELKEHELDEIEIYSWPGRYYETSDGTNLATVLLEARRAQRLRYEAESQYPGVAPGRIFTLKDHQNTRFNRRYMIIDVTTHLAEETYRSDMGSSQNHIAFTSIPDDVQFRAPPITPRPRAMGPETAVVTGPAGEEIHTDEFGRIKVQFHWDRENERNDTSSCWIRVSQTGGLGNIIIPRVGDEVLVTFLNGDPDRPLVVGRVFNSSHMPQYALPANKTRAVWRTKTYKRDTGQSHPGAKELDTGRPGANELRFEDATGEEEVFLHAEKDLKTRVRNDETHHVGKDTKVDIGKDRISKIGNDDALEVFNNIDTKAGNKITIRANTEIKLIVGASSVTIGPASITINTPELNMTGSAKASLTGALTNISGSGSLILSGGIIKIN